jgi:hypothetical protein
LVATVEGQGPVKCEDPADGRVCLVLLTDLIIRVGGKLVCQLFLSFKWFGWCGLGGILEFEGLDKGICWGFCGARGVFYFGYELWAVGYERRIGEKGWWVGVVRAVSGYFALERRGQDERKTNNGEEQTTARTNAGVPPLRLQSAPPSVGMTMGVGVCGMTNQ